MKLTRKKAIELCIELWTWCAETGKHKMSWPRWEEFGYIASYCWFCEYDNRQYRRYKKGCRPNCRYCPLKSINVSHCSITAYKNWDNSRIPRTRKKYAKLFLEQIKTLRSK